MGSFAFKLEGARLGSQRHGVRICPGPLSTAFSFATVVGVRPAASGTAASPPPPLNIQHSTATSGYALVFRTCRTAA
jgi:hypothetical protein